MAIAPLLNETASTLQGFVELLKEEASALSEKRVDDLPGLIHEKGLKADALAASWVRIAKELGVRTPQEVAEMRQILAGRGEPEAMKAWERLTQLTAEARELNLRNGALIREQLLHTGKAIEVLKSAARQNTTYGPDGLADGELGYSSRILGKA